MRTNSSFNGQLQILDRNIEAQNEQFPVFRVMRVGPVLRLKVDPRASHETLSVTAHLEVDT